jgi:cytochrome o ubiquinol oxidase subunit II
MMGKKKPVLFMLVFAGIILLSMLLMQPGEIGFITRRGIDIAVLMPKGLIGLKERNLLLFIQVIMLLVIIPVYILTFIFSWKYRADNLKAKYTPDWDDNKLAEYLWWGIPFVFTLIIVVITWIETHRLDPFKPIASDKKALQIQVVALQWKWLFIYPEEKIATVNFFQFPKERPLHFLITADAPMNSFWLPELGGQIYAMPKMKTQLHLIADREGDYQGSSANLSGEGFAGMRFVGRASSEEKYNDWIDEIKGKSKSLDREEYENLAAPSKNNSPQFFVLKDEDLFEQIIMKFMHPQKS